MKFLLLLLYLYPPPCLQLQGVVQDNATRQPLSAQLFLRTPTGKVQAGSAAEGSGRFSIAVTCQATALVIERTGYRPQLLPLNLNNTRQGQTVGLRIPLVSVDKQTTDRPYQQSEQTHYTQPKAASGESAEKNTVQHNTFTVVDALTNKPLQAKMCFFFTENKPKTCLDANAQGVAKIDFAKKDIVAMEVRAPGYQLYQGNLLIEHLDGRDLYHDIRLLSELTLLSIESLAAADRIDLRATDETQRIRLEAIPGAPGLYCASNLRPVQYELALLDASGQRSQKQTLSLRSGLNTSLLTTKLTESQTAYTVDPAATAPVPALRLPDQIPPIFFEQGTYTLRPDSRAVLIQVATYLKTHPGITVKAIGHTDAQGEESLNRYLSEFRAKVAVNFLFWQGVDEDRLSYAGHGSRYVVAPSDTDENRAKNRRVFLKLNVPE